MVRAGCHAGLLKIDSADEIKREVGGDAILTAIAAAVAVVKNKRGYAAEVYLHSESAPRSAVNNRCKCSSLMPVRVVEPGCWILLFASEVPLADWNEDARASKKIVDREPASQPDNEKNTSFRRIGIIVD